jgi:prepilin-type N-terminal cleavage/methylation domain-containing protein
MTSRQPGFSLPELMVSMALGLLLLAAFFAVLQRCREGFSASESLAALQDNARHALSVIVPDIEHAGFFGFAGPAARYTRSGTVLAEGVQLQQPDAAHPVAPVAGLPGGAHDCGVNFAIDLGLGVEGTNNSYAAGTAASNCAPTASAGGARAGSDTLTLRHASREVTKPLAGRLQLYSRRLESQVIAELFADGQAPGPTDSNAEVRDLEVRKYYLANDSVDRRHWPALRVKAMTEARGAAQFRDEEVLPGVEDLQVEFGVRDPADPESRLSFVPPDFPDLRARAVVAVRLWLRIRADRTEAGYFDARPLQYADVYFVPDALESRQRRLLVQRTVALRNLRPP